jgi:uncharacterized protein (DUF433 family)
MPSLTPGSVEPAVLQNLADHAVLLTGKPVISGTRIPYDEVVSLLRDGVAAEDIGEFFPQVSTAAARDAYDLASYVNSY